MTTLQIPNDIQYVGAALVSTAWLLMGQAFLVGRHRKRAGIQYPQMYAEKAEAESNNDAKRFNCAQRAHQNTLENIPIVWVSTLLAGLQYPLLAASVCGLWTIGRISYTIGYASSGDPKKRLTPLYALGIISQLALLLTASAQSVGWIWNNVSNYLNN